MLAENKEISPQSVSEASAPASAKASRPRETGENGSSRRARKRAARRAAPPRAGATPLVELAEDVDADGNPVVSASQALIDLEIRRSMREARRTRDLQLQQSAAVHSVPADPEATATAETVDGAGGSPEGSAAVAAPLTNQLAGEAVAGAHVVQARQHPGHGQRDPAWTANPLSQHLGLMTQQLTAAHRVIGRVSAERDALRQQVADLQGIPVEEVVIASAGATADAERDRRATATAEAETTESPSRWAKLNYFGGEDVAQMRRRRQTFVLALLAVIMVGAVVARQIGWSMPEDISRDSLAALPVLGNFMYVFLAGWMLFRVVKVSSRGVRWIFPSEDRRRRRR